MRSIRKLLIAGFAIGTAALAQREVQTGPNPPDEAAQKKIIDDTIAKARAYEKDLPDFVCSQVTIRNADPKGMNQWKMLGSTNEELTFLHGKEEYRTVAINGKKVTSESSRAGAELTSTDFATYLRWTFDPKSGAEISWSNWDALRGHRVHVLGFRVAKEHSQMTVGKGKSQISTGFFGVLNVDADSGAILKLGVVATDIPAIYPIQSVSLELNWDFAKVGERYYVLPYRADQHAKEGKKALVWNEIEFREYRKPGADPAAAAKAQ
jgi:hypothetical protein